MRYSLQEPAAWNPRCAISTADVPATCKIYDELAAAARRLEAALTLLLVWDLVFEVSEVSFR